MCAPWPAHFVKEQLFNLFPKPSLALAHNDDAGHARLGGQALRIIALTSEQVQGRGEQVAHPNYVLNPKIREPEIFMSVLYW